MNELDLDFPDYGEDLYEDMSDTVELECPECYSEDVRLIDEEEHSDPYKEDEYSGTEHIIKRNYICNSCRCAFTQINKTITCTGIEVSEHGDSDITIEVRFCNSWYTENNNLADIDDDKYDMLIDDFTQTCEAAGCTDVYVGSKNIKLTGPYSVLAEIIKDGENSDNDISHMLYKLYINCIERGEDLSPCIWA